MTHHMNKKNLDALEDGIEVYGITYYKYMLKPSAFEYYLNDWRILNAGCDTD